MYYFIGDMEFRNSLLLGTLMTNTDNDIIWESRLRYFKKSVECSVSTPKKILYLEFGICQICKWCFRMKSSGKSQKESWVFGVSHKLLLNSTYISVISSKIIICIQSYNKHISYNYLKLKLEYRFLTINNFSVK